MVQLARELTLVNRAEFSIILFFVCLTVSRATERASSTADGCALSSVSTARFPLTASAVNAVPY